MVVRDDFDSLRNLSEFYYRQKVHCIPGYRLWLDLHVVVLCLCAAGKNDRKKIGLKQYYIGDK